MPHNTNAIRNKVLQRVAPREIARIRPFLERVDLGFKETLHEQDQRIDYMYFPESGVVSLVTELREGGSLETGTIGREGVVGLNAFLGGSCSAGRAFCQIPGQALRIKSEIMLEERTRNGQLAVMIFRIVDAMMAMLSQTAACNRAHPVEERLARWLLMTHDRVEGDEFPLTQEFIAMMLGVRRPAVNTAGLALQEAGLIRYTRGRITIVNRPGLEASSCECYEYISQVFERALDGEAPRARSRRR